ncbi:invasion protein IalB [Azospirillum fermentarium]|uniref:hypothetical protein n=1 Tax=Azospirillum fermentarium TaxID=1233114 RepID=UPI002227AA00|nr:hypothetical protein [Azospirillum fermentarium]MCW2246673.1 invasion protein IalB [Azospirillum fermentarium]
MAFRRSLLSALTLAAVLAAQPARAQEPPLREVTEQAGAWRLYCQIWSAPRRLECEIISRQSMGSSRGGALVWYRSSTRWAEGLRFRLDGSGIDVDKGVRVWIDNGLFRPEFPCKPYELEPGSCVVSDPAANTALVQRMAAGRETVSAVGVSPSGAKVDVFFSLKGFRDIIEKMEQVREQAGIPFSTTP